MKIEIWADYACPFCYIGKTTLEQALEQTGLNNVEVVYKAFQLDPNAPKESNENTITHLAHKYGVSIREAQGMVENVIQHGKRVGLDLNFEKVNQTNTFNAHRLTKLAQSLNLDTDLNRRLYKAYFTEGINLASLDELNKISMELGIDSNEVLNSDRYEKEVKRDIEEAYRKGINAVPYFLIDGKTAIKGAQPLERFIQILNQVK